MVLGAKAAAAIPPMRLPPNRARVLSRLIATGRIAGSRLPRRINLFQLALSAFARSRTSLMMAGTAPRGLASSY